MDSLFYTLMTTLKALIVANAGVIAKGATTEIGRIRPVVSPDNLPFIGISLSADNVMGDFGPSNTNFQDWAVNIKIDLVLDGDANITPGLDQDFLNLRADVHKAIMGVAPTLGEDFILQAYPIGGDEPQPSSEGKRKTTTYRTDWGFSLRTAIDDMTTT